MVARAKTDLMCESRKRKRDDMFMSQCICGKRRCSIYFMFLFLLARFFDATNHETYLLNPKSNFCTTQILKRIFFIVIENRDLKNNSYSEPVIELRFGTTLAPRTLLHKKTHCIEIRNSRRNPLRPPRISRLPSLGPRAWWQICKRRARPKIGPWPSCCNWRHSAMGSCKRNENKIRVQVKAALFRTRNDHVVKASPYTLATLYYTAWDRFAVRATRVCHNLPTVLPYLEGEPIVGKGFVFASTLLHYNTTATTTTTTIALGNSKTLDIVSQARAHTYLYNVHPVFSIPL